MQISSINYLDELALKTNKQLLVYTLLMLTPIRMADMMTMILKHFIYHTLTVVNLQN